MARCFLIVGTAAILGIGAYELAAGESAALGAGTVAAAWLLAAAAAGGRRGSRLDA
jgi:hypothetical protein